MPSDWLLVPHHKQSREGLCLPACARMILAYLGQEMDEARLAQTLKTRPFGAPADNIRLLDKLGYTVLFEQGSEFDLRHSIPLDHFLLAWSEFDYEYAVITRS